MCRGSGRLVLFLTAILLLVFPPVNWSCSSSGGGHPDGYVGFGDGGPGGGDGVSPSGDAGPPPTGCNLSQDCPSEFPFCDQFSNTCVECKKSSDCDDADKPMCNPALKTCVECVMDTDCNNEFLHCLEGTCSDKACFPGDPVCVGNSVHICSADGMDPNDEVIPCGAKTCHSGQCLECKPSEKGCKGEYVIQCNGDGTDYTVVDTCVLPLSCYGDECMFCYPGEKKCDGNIAMECNAGATEWLQTQDCSLTGHTCQQGACLSPCAGDFKQNTNAGCEFYAVDLHNAYEVHPGRILDAQNAQFAVIASNTSEKAATVTVTSPDDDKTTYEIPKDDLREIPLPATWGLDGTLKGKRGFRISSSQPITVYQFNPLSNEDVFSNDASVLLPVPALGTEYRIMSYGQPGAEFNPDPYLGYFTVVGVSTVPVQVTFVVAAKTEASADGSIPALSPGQSHTVELTQGEVLNVESTGDLTGTLVEATGPIAVFGGHEATNMADQCCADHLEQQMMPISTWGSHYLVSKTWERWKEKDYVRILAAEDGTHVTVNPAAAIVPELQAGGHYTFQTDVNLEIISDKPVQVAQYLASSNEILDAPKQNNCSGDYDCAQTYWCCNDMFMCGEAYGRCIPPECVTTSGCPSGHTCVSVTGGKMCQAIGDPAMILAVSEEQFMDSYVFLTPDAYAEDYLNIIAPNEAQLVILDHQQLDLSLFADIGGSGYRVFRTPLSDGVHTIDADVGVGIVVYGYDKDVSYGYPGGMGLLKL